MSLYALRRHVSAGGTLLDFHHMQKLPAARDLAAEHAAVESEFFTVLVVYAYLRLFGPRSWSPCKVCRLIEQAIVKTGAVHGSFSCKDIAVLVKGVE